MDHKLISFCDIKKQVRLDQGQFGVVYRAEYNELTVAAKEITPPDTGQEFVKTFKREVEINSQLDHDNVVKFYGACFDPFCIVMEYVAGGSLYHWIYKRKFQFDNETILALLLGMTRGLKYLHDLKVLHRDLKSKNVLIDNTGSVLRPKLCDFGVSKTLNATMNVNTQEIGTVRWMAPEVMVSNTYNYQCDIYSFGVTIYEILEMDMPYRDDEIIRIVMLKAVSKEPLTLSDCVASASHRMFVKVFSQCVEYEPAKRPCLLDLILKLENADLSSDADTDDTLEVDESNRLAWELQQMEYESLSIVTQADEAYAQELQERFYQQTIRPYYHPAGLRKWHDRDYRDGIGVSPMCDIDTVDQVEPASPSSNLDFVYDPYPSLLEATDSLSLSLSNTSQRLEPEPELTPLYDSSPHSDTLSALPSPQSDTSATPSPSPSHIHPATPLLPVISDTTDTLGREEKRKLEEMSSNSETIPSMLGSFVDLGSGYTPISKSSSLELTPRKESKIEKFIKVFRVDSRSKSPEARDRNATYSGSNNKRKVPYEFRARSVDHNRHDKDRRPEDDDKFSFNRATSHQHAT